MADDGMLLSRMASSATMHASTLAEVKVEESYEVKQLERETQALLMGTEEIFFNFMDNEMG